MKSKKYCFGYGWRKSSESLEGAFSSAYGLENLNASLQDAKEDFKDQLEGEVISKAVKPKFFKVIIEEVE